MKRIIFLMILALLFVGAWAQPISLKQFSEKTQRLENEMNQCDTRSATGVKTCYRLYSEIIRDYEQLSPQDRANYQGRSNMANNYYNLACFAARLGKRKVAKKALVRAAKLGFHHMAWTEDDADLITLHGTKSMKKALAIMEGNSYLNVLRKAGSYAPDSSNTFHFNYMYNCQEYARTRQYFNLDSIAGQGDEVSRIKNLMYFVHNNIRHDGNSSLPERRDAIGMFEICKQQKRGINCRMLALMLNEMYLAMGWPSRYVTCMPIDSTDRDCHVINAVYCRSLGKWLWMDPSFAAYVSDDKGNLLSIEEVRKRLIADQPLVLNEDANWNHQNKQTVDSYLKNYMAKNLYLLECSADQAYGMEYTRSSPRILLTPSTDTHCYRTGRIGKGIVTTDAAQFWQKP